jgi:hypothetical protein
MSDPSEYSGMIMARDNGVWITDAPPRARISLEFIQHAEPRMLTLIGRYISLGTAGITYFIDSVVLTAQGVELLVSRIDQNPNAEIIPFPPKVVS